MTLTVWIVLVLALLLAPSPREWGIFGKWLSPRYDLARPYLEGSSHVLLMGVLTYILLNGFNGWPTACSLFFAGSIAFILAVSFEIMQGLLPGSFGRSGSYDDVGYSLIGIVIGCSVGIYLRHGRKS